MRPDPLTLPATDVCGTSSRRRGGKRSIIEVWVRPLRTFSKAVARSSVGVRRDGENDGDVHYRRSYV